jgi:4-amino-4-deoxy-L-arabinose transferase-like glycosyltransferase
LAKVNWQVAGVRLGVRPKPWRLLGLAGAFLFAAAVIPTLSWVEFSNGSENLVTASVLEMARGGPVLVPTLQGAPRVAKPPLATWVESVSVPGWLVGQLDQFEAGPRARAFTELAVRLRLMALVTTLATLLVIAELGRALGGPRVGLLSLVIAASSVLVLRFGRYATTDVQLALWVSCANVALVRAAMSRRWGLGLAVAGMAIGLAMMSKGPVALVQTVLPVAIFVAWQRWREGRDESLGNDGVIAGIVAGVGLMAVIGLPWFGVIAWRDPSVFSVWWREVTRHNATDIEPGAWYSYLSALPYLLPWTAYLVAGLAMAGIALRRGAARCDGVVMAAMLWVIPMLVMSLAKDKNERYLLPMAGPLAATAAFALRGAFGRGGGIAQGQTEASWIDRWLAILHVVIVGGAAAGLAIAGRWVLRCADGGHWYGGPVAGALLALAIIWWAMGAWLVRHPRVMVDGTFVAALVVQVFFFFGYRQSSWSRSELRPLANEIWAIEPKGAAADIWYFDPRPAHAVDGSKGRRSLPVDLSIYLDRIVQTAWEAREILVRSGRDCLAITLQRPDEAELAAPRGWVEVARTEEAQGRVWRAYRVSAMPVRTGEK